MKTKSIIAACAAVGLTACVSSLLWKSVIEGAALTGAALPIVANGNNLYQLYPVGTQLHVRKLSSTGAVEWQTSVDDTLLNSLAAPKLRASATGVVVGYQDNVSKLAYVKHFDDAGNLLWSSDLGEHASETLDDVTIGSNGTVTVAVRLSNTQVNAQQFDSNGTLQWEIALPPCYLICATTLASDSQGNTLLANTELAATKSWLFDSNGAELWYHRRTTGISTLGLIPNKISVTLNGFALHHPFVSWGYNAQGGESWSYSSGSQANIASDGNGNLYVPGVGKISQLDATGTLLTEIDLSDQKSIRQIEWRDDLQRLIVLSSYESVGPEIDGTITAESGQALSIYDATGTRTARYTGKATMVKSSLCTPYPQCTSITTIPGENWSQFTSTTDRKLVVSGVNIESERFAKAYKLP